jgi:hypothetical protein
VKYRRTLKYQNQNKKIINSPHLTTVGTSSAPVEDTREDPLSIIGGTTRPETLPRIDQTLEESGIKKYNENPDWYVPMFRF